MFVSRHSAVGPPSRTELLCMNSDVMLVFKINYIAYADLPTLFVAVWQPSGWISKLISK